MRFLYILIILTVPVTAATAQEFVTLAFPQASLAELATVYSGFTKKKVSFADDSIKGIQLSAYTQGTILSKAQATKYLESAFYLKGIQVTPAEDGSLVLSRYAEFKDPSDPQKRFIKPQHITP